MRFGVILGAFLALVAPARAEIKNFSDFSGGLNTRNAGILLQDNESPSLQNVLIDKNGGISRREGFSDINTAAVGNSSTDVNAVFQFERSNGNKYCLAFSGTSGYYSVDGCATNTLFVSTLTLNNDVNCDAYGDKFYCVNNQYNFSFDGTNDVPVASMPSDLDFIRVFRNRCFGAGKDTTPSRLFWSNLGTCDTWTTSSDYVDLDAEDGDVLTGIGPDLFNFLVPYKKFSTYLLQFDNANSANRKVINVSRSIGAKNHRSITNFNNRQYFASVGPYGGQPGIYSTDGILVQEDTGKLRGSVDSLSNFFSNTGRETVDTKADWDLGTFDPRTMSSSRDSGFMQSSYTTFTDTLSSDFSKGTPTQISATDVSGSVTLASDTFKDDFSDGDFTTNPTWTESLRTWNIGGGKLQPSNILGGEIYASHNVSSGSYRFKINQVAGGAQATVKFFSASSALSSAGYAINAVVNGAATATDFTIQEFPGPTTLCTAGADTNYPPAEYTYQITMSATGYIQLAVDSSTRCTATDTTVTDSNNIIVKSEDSNVNFDDFNFFGYKDAGNLVSQIFDTAISTPILGPFVAQVSSGPLTTATFEVQSSTASDGGGFETLVSQSLNARIGAAARRYLRYKASFTTDNTTVTPRMDFVTVSAASTGTWKSPELFLSNSMTGWGLFQADRTITGNAASIAYRMTISSYSGGTASTGSITVTPGSAIAHSTGAYIVIMATYTVYSASETAKDDVLVTNWTEGTTAKSATMAVFKGRLHFCGQTASGTTNDVCYVRDDKGAWVKWSGVNSRHLNVVGQNLLSGDSRATSTGIVYKLYDTDSDNGAAINAFWESKDHILEKIQNVKAMDRIYLLGSNDATVLTTTVKADSGSRTSAYDLNLSTGAEFRIIHQTITRSLSGNTFRIRFENNAASKPWSVYGYGLLYRDLGLMQP